MTNMYVKCMRVGTKPTISSWVQTCMLKKEDTQTLGSHTHRHT